MKLLEVDESKRPSINDIAKHPLLDTLKELVDKKEKINQEKRKFSFNESVPTLFHKKPEASMQTTVLAPPTVNKNQQNKSL